SGKEIVVVYVSAPSGGLDKPSCELKAYSKTKELAPSESQRLSMKITPYELASYNEKTTQWETAKGEYTALIGASVQDIRCTGSFLMK
ncbi:MAG: fibronectin type III-like domain-contianing protein, partial [Bacteroidales bacterium]|nr:fibronectin type III-like domain-contianing protein [Bacteroidales bacterium]